MRYVISINQKSHLGVVELIQMVGIKKGKYYDWVDRLGEANKHNGKQPKQHWLTDKEHQAIIEYALENMSLHKYSLEDGYRRIAYMGLDDNVFACSPSSVYRALKKAGLLAKWNPRKTSSKGSGFKHPSQPHEQWHTDIKYINYKGTFLFFIGIMDGYSRYIVHHDLRMSMTELDVEMVLQKALEKYPGKKPRIISDNGTQYVSKDFQAYLKECDLQHVKTSPAYPQSNGKIERFHRSLEEECVRKTSLINPRDAKRQISQYVEHYNTQRLHSALYYLRPFDLLNGDVDRLLKERQVKLDRAAEERARYWKEKEGVVN